MIEIGYRTIRSEASRRRSSLSLSLSVSLSRVLSPGRPDSEETLRNSVHVQDGGCSLPPNISRFTLSPRRCPSRFRPLVLAL